MNRDWNYVSVGSFRPPRQCTLYPEDAYSLGVLMQSAWPDTHSRTTPRGYITKENRFFFDRRAVFATVSRGRSRRRLTRPAENRPGTGRARVSTSPSPCGSLGALPKSKQTSQFRGSPLRLRGAEQATKSPLWQTDIYKKTKVSRSHTFTL